MNPPSVKSVRAVRTISGMMTAAGVLVAMLLSNQRAVAQAVHGQPIGSVSNSPAAPAASAVHGSAFDASPTPKPNTPSPTPKTAGDSSEVGFELLSSYHYDVPPEAVTNHPAGGEPSDKQIPAAVKAFDRKQVLITGFMMPIQVGDDNKATEFLILKDQQMCCFGVVPRVNDIVTVKTSGKGFPVVMDQPVTIQGTLHVGAIRDCDGYIVAVYAMDGEKFKEP